MTADYNGALTKEQFLFYEIRIVASLLGQGLSREEVMNKVKKENLFQFPTERMIIPIVNTCFKRIDALGSDKLVSLLAKSSSSVAKQINLYAMMKYNRLVWEFMINVIGEKYRTQNYSFTNRDLNVFFADLQQQNEKIAGWSEATIGKIKTVLKKSLVECNYLDSARDLKLNMIMIAPELESEIRSLQDTAALPAFNCFR